MSPGRPARPPRREGGGNPSRPPSRGNVRGGGPAGGSRPPGGGGGSTRGSSGRPSGGGSGGDRRTDGGGGRPSSSGRSAGGRPRSGAGSRSSRPGGPRSGGPRSGRKEGPPRRQLTAAEQRAKEVRETRVPRPPRDPEAERAKIEGRSLDQWIDEGAIRAEATGAAARAASVPKRTRSPRAVAPETAARIGNEARDGRRAEVLTERLAQAQEAFDRERFDEARHVALRLAREVPNVAAVHELLGLVAYRTGRWKQAATELETAQALHPSVELLPVLADVYRAQRRWSDVEQVWQDVRDASPSQEVMAEARIVAAGALADQGDLQGALHTMQRRGAEPRKVRDHHLRQWYVLGDLHDRAGDPIEAARWFEQIARHDPDFVDVRDRLRSLGR